MLSLSVGRLLHQFSYQTLPTPRTSTYSKPICHVALGTATRAPSVGFYDLLETLTVNVQNAENKALNVPLVRPSTTASSRVDTVKNVGIRLELSNGCAGWGEAAILPSATTEDQAIAMAKTRLACEFLIGRPSMGLGLALKEIEDFLPGPDLASVRAGIEMALIDAAAKTIGLPLWRLFGGASDTTTTDITIPFVSPSKAAELASQYYKLGFNTLKIKVGRKANEDVEVLKVVHQIHPSCSLILDANEGYEPEVAIEVLEKLNKLGITPILLEQPVSRDNWDGLGYVARISKEKFGVSVVADECCASLSDAKRIVEGNLAHVINIKLAKLGVMGALEIIKEARMAGLDLMMGGMVETRLAMGFAGHLAAGLGCFKFIDLDTPFFLAHDPVFGGYEVSGAAYKFTNSRGHAGFLHWDNLVE